jgi:hypothetical protein
MSPKSKAAGAWCLKEGGGEALDQHWEVLVAWDELGTQSLASGQSQCETS